ncbi:MAG: SGNH/GDSL hydrolase family protein [Thermodesulfobacteriota bacterium]|nr:SGNH/GDSL hydrolase family protein [Thermodesulfobacteriota bacterium]
MRFFKALLYILYILTVSLVITEVFVRIWGYSEHYLYDPIYMPYDKTNDIPYIQKPGLNNVQARGLAVINTDSLGLRSTVAGRVYEDKQDKEFRIAITGDSVTFGEGVSQAADTYTTVIQSILNSKQQTVNVSTFNYGVSAYSVQQMWATLQHRMLEAQPDLVIMAVVPEDFTLSRTGTVDKWGYTAQSDGAELLDQDSFLKKVLRKIHLTYFLRDMVYRYHHKGEEYQPGSPVKIAPDSYNYILKFQQTAQQMKLPYLLLLLPPINHTYSPDFINKLTRDNIHFLDLTSLVNEFSPEEYRTSTFDGHPSPIVHRKIAEKTADYLLHSDLIFPIGM